MEIRSKDYINKIIGVHRDKNYNKAYQIEEK
jgi:hypothetical protein